MSDPICGNCGKPLSVHFHEDAEYCYPNTNGDIFTSEPSVHMVYAYLESHEPDMLVNLIRDWKFYNGHAD